MLAVLEVRMDGSNREMTENQPDKVIGRMRCPFCGSYAAYKDRPSGEYRCPCGWRSDGPLDP